MFRLWVVTLRLVYKHLKFNNKYLISNKGFIISLVRTFRILRPRYDGNGYAQYYIKDIINNKRKDFKAHRLVAEYFIPNPNNLPCVNHIDGNKQNNHINNLEWCTYSYNNYHMYKMKLRTPKYKPCVLNDVYYQSITDAANKLNIDRGTVVNWINEGRGHYL